MKKFPIQFTIDSISFAGVFLLLLWTSRGGLKSSVNDIFSQNKLEGITDQVSHIGDLIFLHAELLAGVIAIYAVLQLAGRWVTRLGKLLPSIPNLLTIMFTLLQYLIIFIGVYVFLLHRDGAGLKKSKLLLFPFWWIVAMCLEILGEAITALLKAINVRLKSAAFYMRAAVLILMIAQIAGYQPFKLL